jgi:putative FmdB family regulatory protein
MPIYEYKCSACNTVFEELVSRDPGTPLPCPKCASKKTEKQMSACGSIISSGSGPANCPSAGGCAAAGSSCCSSGGCGMH